MKKEFHFNLRIKVIYICMIVLFISVLLIMNYAFRRSRNMQIAQETGIISQYMNRNELALLEITDAIRNLSAASSTNKQVAAYLNETYTGNVYSSDNINRIRSVEETLTFYRNIFFDYRLHYIILGADGTIYSVADGIDNSNYFGEQFSASVKKQLWYEEFLNAKPVSKWITPCIYDKKGEFQTMKQNENEEEFILFARKIRDYNKRKYLGVSFVSFPTENLKQILIPYEGSTLALFNELGQLIYTNENHAAFTDISKEILTENLMEKEGNLHYTKDHVEYLINYVTIDGPDWKLVNLVPLQRTTEAVDNLYKTVFLLMMITAFGACMICFIMYVYVNAPFNRLIQKISNVNIGGKKLAEAGDVECSGKPVASIGEAEKEIGQMVDYMERLSDQAIKQKEIEQNLRYEMLRAQLNPHFLFNTLNVIKWSAMISGAGNIGDMITSLGILLEHSMNRRAHEVALSEEVKVVKAWVEIKNWALKNRIQLQIQIPEGLEGFKVIPFCIQPLVENAVLHGMDHTEQGEITIKAEHYDDQVCITISDNGVGIEQEKLDQILLEMDTEKQKRQVTGIGLTSIHELMKMKYGSEFGLYIESEVGIGTTVKAIFPYRGGENHAESNDS